MKAKILLLLQIILCSTVGVGLSSSFAQTNPIFVQLGQAKGALYKPDSGPTPASRHHRHASRIELHEQYRLQRILEKRISWFSA